MSLMTEKVDMIVINHHGPPDGETVDISYMIAIYHGPPDGEEEEVETICRQSIVVSDCGVSDIILGRICFILQLQSKEKTY